MEERKRREEMNPVNQWDLSPVCVSGEAFEKGVKEVMADAERISSFQGRLGEGDEAVLACFDLINRLSEKAERLYTYAFLLSSGDGGDATAQKYTGLGMNMFVKLETVCSFIEPELLALPAEKLERMKEQPSFRTYRFRLENLIRSRAHTLSADQEGILARMADLAETPSGTYDMLTDVDMKHGTVVDTDGKEIELTGGTFGVLRASADRRVRKDAFETYFGDYKQFNNTIAKLYSGSVKQDWFFASVRGHESSLKAALFPGNVPESVYRSLIEAIHCGLPIMRRYLELRRRVLDLPEMDTFDLYLPLVPEDGGKVPFEEGKKLVKEALKVLGEDYGKMLDRAFSERWIDVYENVGKASGAFSTGVYGVHPYVMLNYQDELEDVFTLAHELGHSMHSWYSDKTQPYETHDYRIMVAEVASTVNEVLLAKYLLSREKEPTRRASILNMLCEGFRTTVFRQTMFAEFELAAHEALEEGTVLTAEELNFLYMKLEKEYYEGIGVPEIMQYEWSYIPHFYRNFYVYQYATGYCSAVRIAENLLKTGDPTEYLRFLTTGGSAHPIDELKIAGVDLTDPATVASALQTFDRTITELGELLEKK